MNVLRTPDERFADLPDFPWDPHYIDDLPGSAGLRVHYVDAGPPDAPVVWLCLHGQPTWSYLYRKMIPVFTAAGDRVIAPDFFGFGRSDKPVDDAVYTFDVHRRMLLDLINRLDLTGIRLVCQDWGGLLGLTLPMECPDRFDGLVAMNTAFNTGDIPLGDGFLKWRAYANSQDDLDIAGLMQRAVDGLSDEEARAYAAPFPDRDHKGGVRRFPRLVADRPDADGAALSRQARDWFGREWNGRSVIACGMKDPVLGPAAMKYLRRCIRHAPDILELPDAGHFVQESGIPVAEEAVRVLR